MQNIHFYFCSNNTIDDIFDINSLTFQMITFEAAIPLEYKEN